MKFSDVSRVQKAYTQTLVFFFFHYQKHSHTFCFLQLIYRKRNTNLVFSFFSNNLHTAYNPNLVFSFQPKTQMFLLHFSCTERLQIFTRLIRGDIIMIIIKWVVKIIFKLVWLPVFSASQLVFSLPFKTSNNTDRCKF